jgi:hypothetical protein
MRRKGLGRKKKLIDDERCEGGGAASGEKETLGQFGNDCTLREE